MAKMEDATLYHLLSTWDEIYQSGNGTIEATLHARPKLAGELLTGEFTFGEVMQSVICELEYDGKVERLTYDQAMRVMQWLKTHQPRQKLGEYTHGKTERE